MTRSPFGGPARGVSQFGRYWLAAAISSYGTAVTAVALPTLLMDNLHASPLEVSVANAALPLPYALLGMVAGVFVDRWRRRPVLIWSSLGRAVSLAAVPLLYATGHLNVPLLVLTLLLFGSCSVFAFAATQALLPRLVPREGLLRANARLDQTEATSMTLGPAAGAALVGLVGAPLAVLLDAITYVVEAVLIGSVRVEESRPAPMRRDLVREVREGLSWTYRHVVLGRLALSTHVWFLANGIALTTVQWLIYRTWNLGHTVYGYALMVLGAATLAGASLAPAIGTRLGAGRTVLIARGLYGLVSATGSAWRR